MNWDCVIEELRTRAKKRHLEVQEASALDTSRNAAAMLADDLASALEKGLANGDAD